MDILLETYVKRISQTLEEVVAPEIESDFVRGQLFAAIELLGQLQGRVEQRQDFLRQDIESGMQTLKILTTALEDAGVLVPEETRTAFSSLDLVDATGAQLKEERERLESAISSALGLLHSERSKIGRAEDVERAVLEQLQQGIFRDLMLFRPQRFDRISRSKRKGEP